MSVCAFSAFPIYAVPQLSFWLGLYEINPFQKAATGVAYWPSVKTLRSANRQIQSLANTACSQVAEMRLPFQV